ncbi:hypothetical protein SAMN05428966_102430 [Massilia sp. PDC64]|nr:hypothetical protein SAMN05428966_102430 [Massilia sp. PDC64]
MDKVIESKQYFFHADFLGSGQPVLRPRAEGPLFTQTVENDVSKSRDSILSV